MYACIYVSIHLCVYVSLCLCIHVSIYLCMYVCMYVRTHVPTYVLTYVRMYVSTDARMWRMLVCTYARMPVSTYVRMYVCTYVCTYSRQGGMYVSMFVCPYVCLCVCLCVYVCAWCMCVRAIIDVKLLLMQGGNLSWLPNVEGCIHDWYDSGTLESRTCYSMSWWRLAKPRAGTVYNSWIGSKQYALVLTGFDLGTLKALTTSRFQSSSSE
jgi:hypothetical protein